MEVAERMRATFEYVNDPLANAENTDVSELCSIDTDGWTDEEIEQFLFEISAPRKDIDRMGKFKVESKPDMLKRGIKSPNKADAAIMFWMKPIRAAAGFFDL